MYKCTKLFIDCIFLRFTKINNGTFSSFNDCESLSKKNYNICLKNRKVIKLEFLFSSLSMH